MWILNFLIPLLAHNFPIQTTEPGTIKFTDIYPTLTFSKPIFLTEIPDSSQRLVVVEQGGRIYAVKKGDPAAAKQLLLDLSSEVSEEGSEDGLLGLAFDPLYSQNRFFYLNYTVSNPLRTRIVRFEMKSDGTIALPASKKIILEFAQPYTNHNGGMLAFGPDKMLYIGVGDGGSGGDPHNNGQSLNTFLGKLLRIDVRTLPYRIPADNPFVGQGGVKGEIWAYGLRNPWRFSFDKEKGTLWLGDVGQSAREEIDQIEKGKNYGWKVCEGKISYMGEGNCPQTYVAPIFDYPRSEGGCITGGYLYRGSKNGNLRGSYIYGDYISKKVWGLYEENGKWKSKELALFMQGPTSFGEDLEGELYVMGFSAGQGKVYRIDSQTPQSSLIPKSLGETGLFSNVASLTPNSGLIPYNVNSPLWSDGAEKKRWMVLPAGEKISFQTSGAWKLPIGSAIVKHFEFSLRKVETRVLVHEQKGWHGYTYRWRATQNEADLLEVGMEEEIAGIGTWQYPSRSDCFRCHTQADGYLLGIRSEQLSYGNQISQWQSQQFFDSVVSLPTGFKPYSSLFSTASLEEKVRSYLAVNCSMCHQPGGPTPVNIDLKFSTPLALTKLLDVDPTEGDLGITGAKRLVAGNKEMSLLWVRMGRRDSSQMPPIATHQIDPDALQLVGQWVDGLARN